MFRSIVRIVWFALGAIVGIWAYDALLGLDQRHGLLPFLDGDRETSVIVVGVFWGIISMLLAATESGRLDGPPPSARTARAMARVIEAHPHGTTAGSSPVYDVFVEVTPADEPAFVSAMRTTVDASTEDDLRPGSELAVRYAPGDHDHVDRATEETPEDTTEGTTR